MISLGHHWLYQVMGILHCDISLDNIMICCNGAKVIGILIDYDLATDINKLSTSRLE
jgi:serine/threonine protein kinase